MKLHALMIAAALALAGTAFAQAPYGTAKAPADTGASASASTRMSTDKPAKAHKKHVAKAKKAHARQHASAMHHGHHDMHARAHMRHHDTRAMGAGAARPATDLNASSREARMNSAYEDWLRLQRR